MKKIIGLCVNQISNGENFRRIELIQKLALEKGYNIIVFPIGTALNALNDKLHAEAFYWMESGRFDAILIDAKGMKNDEFIKSMVRKAKKNHIPTVVMNTTIPNAACISTSVDDGFADLISHLIGVHNCKTFGFVGGMVDVSWDRTLVQERSVKLLEVLRHIMSNHHLQNGILWDNSQVMEKAETVAMMQELIRHPLPDAIVCANDSAAVTVCKVLSENHIKVPEQVIVTGMGRSLRGVYYKPTITGCEQNYESMGIQVFETLEKLQRGEDVPNMQVVPPRTRFCESCGCQEEIVKDSMDMLSWMYDAIHLNEQYESELFNFTEEFLKTVTVDEISQLLNKTIAKNALVCVRDSFMQDIFTENSTVPDKNEKFYILADRRENSRTWESFQLYEIFPGLTQCLEDDRIAIIIPINYQNSYYGYLVFCPETTAEHMFGMEKFARNLNSTLGRYINERKLRFANHELICANENVKRMQIRDVLTGLLNSNGFRQKMESLISKCVESNERIMVFCVDLDRLANINEIFGHAEGDTAIQTIAHMIQEEMSPQAVAARLGSDEFVVATAVPVDEVAMKEFEFGIQRRLDNYNSTSGKEYSIEINYCQTVITPTIDLQVREILDEAFTRKRMVKDNKRSRQIVRTMDGRDRISKEELESVTEVVDQNEFSYAFQPIVSAKSGEIVAYEALMRTSQERNLSPLTIIRCASNEGRLYDIEMLTLNNVMKIVKEQQETLGNRKVFINSIPSNQLTEEDYFKLRRKYAKIMQHVVVEITEQTELDAAGIEILRKRSTEDGFEVAIDDFGTGYSNTASLLRYLPNYVKIDRALVENVDNDSKKKHFMNNIVEFAHDNGFLALAEGVETVAELSSCIKMGVDLIQGYYTARPAAQFLMDIQPTIVEEIVRANIDGRENLRKKIYVVNKEETIFLMQLATEQYTGMVVAQNELSILGNSDFVAGMSIKIKENTNCRLHLHNVKLCSENELPCIDLGKNVILTLVLEGDNEFYDRGIRVPEGSELRIEGKGNLSVILDSVDTYCIGNAVDKDFGAMTFDMDGTLYMHIAGKQCIAIGGGYSSSKEGIHLNKGKFKFDLAGLECIAIGNIKGMVPILLENCDVDMEIQIAKGSGIGSMEGPQNIAIKNTGITMKESGNYICGIGTSQSSSGSIDIIDSNVTISVDGRKVYLIGCESGDLQINATGSLFVLNGQASYVLGMGTYVSDAGINMKDTDYSIIVRAGQLIAIGAKEKDTHINGGTQKICNKAHE